MTKPLMYVCQFCGKESLASEWKKLKDKCPKCKRDYDVQMAQDSEE